MKKITLFKVLTVVLVSGLCLIITLSTRSLVPVAQAKEIKLVVATHLPPKYTDIVPLMQTFANDINEQGAGRVKVDFHHSSSLLSVKELITGLEMGTADIIWHNPASMTGAWPILGGLTLPFLFKNARHVERAMKVGSPMYEFINNVLAEKHGAVFISYGVLPEEYIMTNKLITKIEDFKGLKIRAGGESEAKAVKEFGASPVWLTSNEMFQALQRKTIDGVVTYLGTASARSLQEVVKYLIKVPVCIYGMGTFVKKDKWDKLPKDVRNLIYMSAIKFSYFFLDNAEAIHSTELWPMWQKSGVKIIDASPELIENLREKSKPVWSEWSNEVGADIGNKFFELTSK